MAVIELYEVSSDFDVLRFTSHQFDVLYKGLNWQSHVIERGGSIEQSDDPLRSDAAFEVAAGSPLANLALNPPLSTAPKVSILRSEDGGKTFFTVFAGRLMAGVWNDGFVAVELEAVHTELQVTGLKETVTPQCRFALGSRKCGVAEKPKAVTVKAVDGLVVTLTTALPMSYAFGKLRHNEGLHFIDRQVNATQLKLLHPASIPAGTKVTVFRGCDRSLECCHQRFNNAVNFGGSVNLPKKNPYVGDPIDR
ncbi:phage BR0599 family protein [Photobacterium sanguinicancri]|uniref:phage BR0599 family protein n=1 Tax=Photobacterium sanguinicancri TaxID=875932 RepID=UPI0026E42130|nr:phage BR0599 family protein [Photobacterium sanguinicancri]MDO6497319.1 phage BR0599 family protein [Photobacterium sanguinicancri]